jgi:hypothetical protein
MMINEHLRKTSELNLKETDIEVPLRKNNQEDTDNQQ